MRITDLASTATVCILGYGKDGQAVHRVLQELVPTVRVTIGDGRAATVPADLRAVEVRIGPGYLDDLDQFDLIIRSPGLAGSPELAAVESKVTTTTQIFFDTVAGTGAVTIGVTGSKGKSTTTNLIAAALRSTYDNVHLVGNIGVPMISYLADAVPGTYFVIELSSYQLETLSASPDIAVLTSLFPEHLDRHGSFEAYREAKTRLVRFQRPDDVVFYNGESEDVRAMAAQSAAGQIPFYPADFPLEVSQTRLRGDHNRGNLAAALHVALRCGVPRDTAIAALAAAETLEHRLQSIGVSDGIEWVDDALATAPEPTIAALRAFGDRVDTILLGGQDRGYDFAELGRVLAAMPVRNLVLFPDSGAHIRDAVEAADPAEPKRYLETKSMAEAVAFAREHGREGSVCLLSTASPSYSIFRDHADKAAQFAAAVSSGSAPGDPAVPAGG